MHKPLFSNALGNMQCPQEHLKTIVYAKFRGQTKCIMVNLKIENIVHGPSSFSLPLGGRMATIYQIKAYHVWISKIYDGNVVRVA